MSHLNLVMFMGAATGDQGQPVIVTEFCHGGTLFEVLHEKKRRIEAELMLLEEELEGRDM